ncbi:MAG: cbb3-type cytochrome c oxidase subunit I [Acidobacteriota bacterium]
MSGLTETIGRVALLDVPWDDSSSFGRGAARFGVETIGMSAWLSGARLVLTGPIYVSIDLDAFDPAFAPGVAHRTHGSQVTVSHGHLAFFGAYALLNLTFFYFAIPRIKQFPGGEYDERGGHWGFWAASLGVVGMSLAFGVAGVLQSYLERMQGQPFMVAQQPIRFWMMVAAIHGVAVLVGVIATVHHLLTLRPAPRVAA